MFDSVLPAVCIILATTLLIQSFANRSLRTQIRHLEEQIRLLRELKQRPGKDAT